MLLRPSSTRLCTKPKRLNYEVQLNHEGTKDTKAIMGDDKGAGLIFAAGVFCGLLLSVAVYFAVNHVQLVW